MNDEANSNGAAEHGHGARRSDAPVDGPKKPWVKPSIKIVHQNLALVESGPQANIFTDEGFKYRPS